MACKVSSELRRWLGILSLSTASLGLALTGCGDAGSPVALTPTADPSAQSVNLYFDGNPETFEIADLAVALALFLDPDASVEQIQAIAQEVLEVELSEVQITGAGTDPLANFDLNADGIPGAIEDLGVAVALFLDVTSPDQINALCQDILGQSCQVEADTPLPGPGATPFPRAGLTPIFAIQGAAQTSPLQGQAVVTSGIVTAVDSNGFYLQDPEGDSDRFTADGIFVFTGDDPTVAVGDQIEIAATVGEFTPGGVSTRNLSTTQLSDISSLDILSSDNPLPEPVTLAALLPPDADPNRVRIAPTEVINTGSDLGDYNPDVDGIDFFESLEGMRVRVQDALVIAGTNRFGEIFTVADNGINATGLSQRGTLNIAPDDFNPEKIQLQFDQNVFDFEFPNVKVGDRLGSVTGVLGYAFGNFEVIVTEDFVPQIVESSLIPQTTALSPTDNQLLVATYNVLNLDPNDQDQEGDADVANGRFTLIGSQIVNNLNAPDIVCLQEVQDNTGSVDDGVIAADLTLQALVEAVQTAGGPTYLFLDNPVVLNNEGGGQPGGNIRTALLYNPDRVALVAGSVGSIDTDGLFVTTPINFFDSRPPLVAEFRFNGQNVLKVCNHFSSKGGSAAILGVEQPFEQRQEDPTVNGSLDERQAQSQAVSIYLNSLLAADGEVRAVVSGDFNEFEFVSPLLDLESTGGLSNLINEVPETERYSFIFQGNSQQLDHILISDNLRPAQVEIVYTNIEFPETPQRASDHDPVLAVVTVE